MVRDVSQCFISALMDTHIKNGLLAAINGLHVCWSVVGQLLTNMCACCAQQVLSVLSVLFRLIPKQVHFYFIANHAVTKKMQFFLFVGDSCCHFLRYIYGACLVIGD